MTTVSFYLGDFLYREKILSKGKKINRSTPSKKKKEGKRGQPVPAAIC